MYGEVVDFESCVVDMRYAYVVEFPVFEVDDLVADLADQVMVAVDFAVEPRRRTRMVQAADDSQIGQHIQNSIDRGPRDSRNALLNDFKDFICRGVIVSFEDGLKNNVSLHRERHSPASAQRLEVFQSLGDLIGLHVHDV